MKRTMMARCKYACTQPPLGSGFSIKQGRDTCPVCLVFQSYSCPFITRQTLLQRVQIRFTSIGQTDRSFSGDAGSYQKWRVTVSDTRRNVEVE
jgi:hypothetical protein